MKQELDKILNHAVSEGATDIHFTPNTDAVKMTMRIFGSIQYYDSLTHSDYSRMLSFVKFSANLDVSEKKAAQSGLMSFICNEVVYKIRASTLPQSIGNEALVLRIIKESFQTNYEMDTHFKEVMHRNNGLVLISGPTGSGKSTLMYQMLHYAHNVLKKHVITIEDPVEQELSGTVQINVNQKAGITYQSSMKAILRCDPDVIMIGEIRDEETAENVINAGLSGHLVISTIHANSVKGTIQRLLDMNINKSDLSECILLISNQRLVYTKIGMKRISETFNHKMVREYIQEKSLTNYESLDTQLKYLYDNELISMTELMRYSTG